MVSGRMTIPAFLKALLSGLLLGALVNSCTRPVKEFEFTDQGDIWFRQPGIALRFDKHMYCTVFDTNRSQLNVSPAQGILPGHFLITGKDTVGDFAVVYDKLLIKSVTTGLGEGRQLILTGMTRKDNRYHMEKRLSVTIYSRYPHSAIFAVTYTNLGDNDIQLDTAYEASFRLDASLTDPSRQPFEFWSFQGASLAWGIDYIFPLTFPFHQENWMGVQPDTKTGGGIPLADLWTPKAGFAVSLLDTVPRLVSLPVTTLADKQVAVSVKRAIRQSLAPGDSLVLSSTAVTIHQGDFFEPLHTYASMLADMGLKRNPPADGAWDPVWCGWGYLTNFTKQDIYQTLPMMKQLGLKWIDLDDRWWDRYGDWNPRKYTFPGGVADLKTFLDSLHRLGFKVRVWWAPTPVQPDGKVLSGVSVDPGMATIAKQHPDWLIMDQHGTYPKDCRGMYQFCPTVPGVQQYMKQLTTRFIGEWGFDGHKLDAYYVVPPCFNPAHHHTDPGESYRDLPKLLRAIYTTSKSIKPYSVMEVCNCGTTQDYFQSIYTDQPVISDPTSVVQERQRIKVFKALWGSNAPVFTDHVEHIRPNTADINDKSDTARVGDDFASSIGPGGVPGTKFTWPSGPHNMILTQEKEAHWSKWLSIYNCHQLSKGSYLNLYDVVYDKPETHAIQKGDTLFYACYAETWTGEVNLRGLQKRSYRVIDYENNRELGSAKGPVAALHATFSHHLLIACFPAD